MSLIDNVLTWTNNQRGALGMPTLAELPVGIPGDDFECALGRCFNGPAHTAIAGTMSTHVRERETGTIHELIHPDYVRVFVRAFDDGRYPELIDEAA